MGKVLLFLAFLVVYGLYIWTSVMLLTRFVGNSKKSGFIENELMIVIPYFFFFAFVFIIGRFFNLHLFVFSILFANIGLIITSIIWSLIGSPKTPFKEIGGWAGGDFGLKNTWLTVVSQGFILLMFVAFPIVIGIRYFSLSDGDAIRTFALISSIILVLGAYVLSLPIFIGVITSSFIDEDTRARYFINQFSSVIAYSLFVSLLFRLFNWDSTEEHIQLGNLNFSLSTPMFLILMGFILAFLILPYFIGVQKAKRLKNDFLEINKRLLSKIVETINLATDENLHEKIESLEKQLLAEFNMLVESDKGVGIGVRYDQLTSEKEVSSMEVLQFKYYKIARPFDTRFTFYDFLNDTYIKLEELKNLNMSGGKQTEEIIDKYVTHFQTYKDDLSKKEDGKGKSNPALWIGIITVLSPFISQAMSEMGKYLMAIFKGI
jgi:hypothetical protein